MMTPQQLGAMIAANQAAARRSFAATNPPATQASSDRLSLLLAIAEAQAILSATQSGPLIITGAGPPPTATAGLPNGTIYFRYTMTT
jgi:hypothetical protein